jgi:hypothetical protein
MKREMEAAKSGRGRKDRKDRTRTGSMEYGRSREKCEGPDGYT